MKHTNRNKPVDLRDGVETMVEIKVGNIYPTVSCGDVELLEHNNYNDIKVKFLRSGIIKTYRNISTLRSGQMRDKDAKDDPICPDCKVREKRVGPVTLKDGSAGIRTYPRCKECGATYDRNKNRSLGGCITKVYNRQKSSSRTRKHPLPNYTKEEFTVWCKENGYNELHAKWAANGYIQNDAPSADRLDDNKPYSLDNLRLVTWKENHAAQASHKSKAVYVLNLLTGQERIYPSINSMARHEDIKSNRASEYVNATRTINNRVYSFFDKDKDVSNLSDDHVFIDMEPLT